MAVDFQYIKENIDEYTIENVLLTGAASEGIALNVYIDKNIDIVDFAEILGVYFYRLDDPKFGQKYVNENTRLYIYEWLTQILNTGNYDETEDGFILELNLYLDFERLNTLRYALNKYKNKYKQDLKNKELHIILIAEKTAINIIELLEKVRITQLEK